MVELFSIHNISLGEKEIRPGTVFEATVAQAKQFDALGAARPATKAEIDKAERAARNGDTADFFDENDFRPAEMTLAMKDEVSSLNDSPDDPAAKPKAK